MAIFPKAMRIGAAGLDQDEDIEEAGPAPAATPVKNLVVPLAITGTLILYIAPIFIMLVEAIGLLIEWLTGRTIQAGNISTVFLTLISAPNGPLRILQKGVGILASGGLVTSLWSRKNWILEFVVVLIVALGISGSLILWSITQILPIATDMRISADLPNVNTYDTFSTFRDSYFTGTIETLLSFGAIFIGVKLSR